MSSRPASQSSFAYSNGISRMWAPLSRYTKHQYTRIPNAWAPNMCHKASSRQGPGWHKMQRKPTGKQSRAQLPWIECLTSRMWARAEKHLGLSWRCLSISLPKKTKSKSKLHNTLTGLPSHLPLFQFSLQRMSGWARLWALAEIRKSAGISVAMSGGYGDRLACICSSVNNSPN